MACLPAVLVALSLAAGCAQTTGVSEYRATKSFEGRCAPPAPETRAVPITELAGEPAERITAGTSGLVLRGFAWQSLQTAEAIEVLPLLLHMTKLEKEAPAAAERELRLLKVRQHILSRISLANLEVSGSAAQAGCEEERAHQLADRLQKAEGARIRQQTLLAVLIGGLTNIATGGLGLALTGSVPVEIASIVGGVLGGAFGWAALYNETKQRYETTPNLLNEIWSGPEQSALFPPAVWRFLHRPMRQEAEGRTFRDELIAGWQQEGRLGTPGTPEARARKQLLFSDGGLYGIDDLVARAQMHDMLESTINLMHQDLEQLMREVVLREAQSE